MASISFEQIDIPDAYIINAFKAEDKRGYFIKNFEQHIFAENGLEFDCSEDFVSMSYKNIIRGMHFQLHKPQAKLVSCVYGMIYDVLVDLRKDSRTFGKWQGVYLPAEDARSLYIPRGCAHGFLVMSDMALVSYKCDGAYDKETDTGILYSDMDIGVKWPIEDMAQAVVGDRDKQQMTFAEFKDKYGGF